MPKPPVNTQEFNSLVEIVKHLRGPDGCPWDKEQTNNSLTQYAIEEAHELAEAIDRGQDAEIVEELGDLLLQVLLHSEIGRQEKKFELQDVIKGISEKMIRRHPHVFADSKVKDSTEVLAKWAEIKSSEKQTTGDSDQNPFQSIPVHIPALIRAQKVGAKTVRYNFDWENIEDVVAKVDEELAELKEAIAHKSKEDQQEELGDLLFSIVQLARHLNFDAEQSLRKTNKKFEFRFMRMREIIKREGMDFKKLTVSELERFWKKAK